MYCLRLNKFNGYEQLLLDFFQADDYTRVFIGFHTGQSNENPHWHIVFDTQVRKQAMRKRLLTVFTAKKGNGNFSLKDWDGDLKAISYIYHEDANLVPVFVRGFSPDDLLEAKQLNVQIQTEIKENAPLKICELVYEKFKHKQIITEKEIAYAIWDHCKSKGDWFPNRFQMDRYIHMIQSMCAQTPDQWEWLKKKWYAALRPFEN